MLGQYALFAPDATLPLRQRVSVELITVAQARYTLEQFHYLHRTRTGRQLNYAVLIDGIVDGVITYACPFMVGKIDGIPTDQIIEFARLFLFSNIPHTATCAIGKTLRRIRDDWLNAFPSTKPLQGVVSWSDREYHKGTIYKAANFDWYHTGGGTHQVRGRPEKWKAHPDQLHIKDCWIYRWEKTP